MKLKRAAKRIGIALAVMLLGAAASPLFGGGTPEPVIYNLRVGSFVRIMPDGEEVTLWGYAVQSFDARDGLGEIEGDNVLSVPGPRLTVAPGRGLTVRLQNELLVPVSILIPGQALPRAAGATSPQVVKEVVEGKERVTSFVHVTPAGAGGVEYIWPSIAPGTYLYHSGTHPAVQVQMGLYGALTRNARQANPAAVPPLRARAYPGVANEYDQEMLFLYSEIDPVLHNAVAAGTYGSADYPSTLRRVETEPNGVVKVVDGYQPKYFLVNGEVLDDTSTLPANVTTVGSATLLRFLNASLWDHVPQFLGTHVTVLAEDGKLYPYPRQHYSLLLPAGKTLDALLTPAAEGQINIFDRRLFRSQLPDVQGSMHARIVVNP
jgi:FtsP/CotA-like multicopper oxidase with cupredoxin domain